MTNPFRNYFYRRLNVLKWAFSILLPMVSISCIINGGFLSALAFLLMGFLLFPPFDQYRETKIPFFNKGFVKGVALFLLFIIGAIAMPKTQNKKMRTSEVVDSERRDSMVQKPYGE